MKQQIKKGVIFGITASITMFLLGAVYAAWDDVVNSGDPVSSSSWNAIVAQIKSQEIPAGFVGSFNLSSCPTGWSAADGTNGTPDLRGEFIRGLDNGRGVDGGRALASFQGDVAGPHKHNISATSGASNGTSDSTNTQSNFRSFSDPTYMSTQGTGIGSETRPRNVALLYCVKD